MPTPIAYHNGCIIPAADLSVSVFDAGFVLGATVAEQMRTFGGTLFRLPEHMQRLERSLELVGIELPYPPAQLQQAAEEVAVNNYELLEPGDDLGLCLFVTPGPYAAMAPAAEQTPTVAMHTFPVSFASFAATYQQGQALVSVSIPQISPATLPRELKCRSRMHYHLADREAAQRNPAARALMLDADQCVLETTSANVLIYRKDEGLLSPPRQRILPGISVAATLEIATKLGLPHVYRELSLADCLSADEMMITSTSVCILPVVSLDGNSIGEGRPGTVFASLLAGWTALTGVNVAEQAGRFSSR